MHFASFARLCFLTVLVHHVFAAPSAPLLRSVVVQPSNLTGRRLGRLSNSNSDNTWWSRIGGWFGVAGVEDAPPPTRRYACAGSIGTSLSCPSLDQDSTPLPLVEDRTLKGLGTLYPENAVDDGVPDLSRRLEDYEDPILPRHPALSGSSGTGIGIYEEMKPV
ncbi:hypothetical protein PENSPDRAFT_648279 [Peniophora sp. CONT]|nr:hypothetical protein PENSPDRAFT_648279 [Peniophora sp. CONT]